MIYHGPGRGGLIGLETTVRRTTKELRPILDQFDSIIVQGLSGVVVGIPVGLRLKKPVVILRKPDENCHSGIGLVNRYKLGRRVLFLDDFISNGDTLRRCKEAVKKERAEIVRTFEYRDYTFDSEVADEVLFVL